MDDQPICVQRTDFVAVPTRERERAISFYERTLGLTKNQVSPTWIEFETGNLTLSIVVPEEVGMEFVPLPFGTIMLRVADVAAARARLEEAGVEFLIETWDSGVCNGAVFRDPDGNSLGLHHRYAPYSDGRTALDPGGTSVAETHRVHRFTVAETRAAMPSVECQERLSPA